MYLHILKALGGIYIEFFQFLAKDQNLGRNFDILDRGYVRVSLVGECAVVQP